MKLQNYFAEVTLIKAYFLILCFIASVECAISVHVILHWSLQILNLMKESMYSRINQKAEPFKRNTFQGNTMSAHTTQRISESLSQSAVS